MNRITVNIPSTDSFSYPVMITTDVLFHPEKWLPESCHHKRIVILTDDHVKHLYGEKLQARLSHAHPLLFSFPAGETSKNHETKRMLEETMLQNHCHRDTVILALGGGVAGDLAGFIAATYMRGVPCIQLPTTLLAMIDSSVGGKTGINTPQGKNLIGAFWQPMAVVADLNCLATLPENHFINGLIEAIKIFLTSDETYFQYTLDHIDAILARKLPVLQKIIERAVQLKADVVSQDEREMGFRMILNFGHTIGHAIEKITDYTLLHGHAVALGILVETQIAELSGLLSRETSETIRALFLKLHISGNDLKSFNPDEIIQATKTDKKMQSNHVRYILLKSPGEVQSENGQFSCPVSDDLVLKALLAASEV